MAAYLQDVLMQVLLLQTMLKTAHIQVLHQDSTVH